LLLVESRPSKRLLPLIPAGQLVQQILPSPVKSCLAVLLTVLLSLLASCAEFPKDPEGTLNRVRGGVLRVGVSENPPWTSLINGRPAGIEAQLVEELASDLKANIEWVPGSETQLMAALRRFELDLVVAGLDEESPWTGRVGFTKPYVRTTSLVGAPPGTPAPLSLSGQEVAVRRGDPIAERVRDEGGRPVPAEALPLPGKLIAGEDWQLAVWAYQPTRFVLKEHRRVVAAPPGENGWIVHLQRFLSRREAEVRAALLSGAKP
jgi:polar amino acid transport system substrate-binding protein